MADAIFNRHGAKAPPLDTVLLWLTGTVERDLAERGAFPEMRQANARALRGAASMYYLTKDAAEAILEDALANKRFARGGRRGPTTDNPPRPAWGSLSGHQGRLEQADDLAR